MRDKINSILRFDPDGECISVAVDFIFFFFRKEYLNRDRIKNIKNIIDIIKFLKEQNFHYIISSPPLSTFSPIYWYIKFKYGSISRNNFIKKRNELSQFVILIQDIQKKIYGIKNENWIHFIVYYKNCNEDGIYDPLKFILEKESYPKKLNNLNKEIMNNGFFKILVWI